MRKKLILETIDPEDELTLQEHLDGPAYSQFIHDWEDLMRRKVKYEENPTVTWEDVRDAWVKVKSDYKFRAED